MKKYKVLAITPHGETGYLLYEIGKPLKVVKRDDAPYMEKKRALEIQNDLRKQGWPFAGAVLQHKKDLQTHRGGRLR